MRLRPLQAWALAEFLHERGGVAWAGPGTGKTLISFLVVMLLGWQRAVLFVPASLRDKTLKIDYPLLARHWLLPPLEGPNSVEVHSYEALSRTNFADYLEMRRIPDGVVFDEVHYIMNRGSGRGKRWNRFIDMYPTTEVVGMTGSPVHRSIMNYGHFMHYALKDTSPVPQGFMEQKTWADALDEGIPDFARPEFGALWDFCLEGETVRDGYRRRMLETIGVVSSPDLSTNIGLEIRELPAPKPPKEVVEAFHRLRNTGELPGGEVCTTKMDQVRHARELFLGFYLKWLWPEDKPDKEWIRKRRMYRKYIRKMTTRSHGGIHLDTEAQVVTAYRKGDIVCAEVEMSLDGKSVLRTDVDVCAEWFEISAARAAVWGDKEPPKAIVWLSDYMVVELERWAAKHTGDNAGIVWIENVLFLDEFRKRGHPCFGAGENEIELESGKRSVFASFAHSVGKNLHMFHHMCFSNPQQSGKAIEQTLGRQHRPRQTADTVFAEVFLGCRESWWAFERCRMDAKYIESTIGTKQRLNMATIVTTPDTEVITRCDSGDPLWAETGHSKIDDMFGVVGPDGKRQASATPILAELRRQAKEGKEILDEEEQADFDETKEDTESETEE